MSYIIKYKNGRITESYRLLKMLEEKSRFRSDVQKSPSNADTALTQAYSRFEENGLASRRRIRNPRTNRLAYLYSITQKGRDALREADLRHKFPIGTNVYYDMYPHGRNIPAVVTNNGVEAIGEWKRYFERIGVASYAEMTAAQNITKRDNTTNAASSPPDIPNEEPPERIIHSGDNMSMATPYSELTDEEAQQAYGVSSNIKIKVKKGNKESKWVDVPMED